MNKTALRPRPSLLLLSLSCVLALSGCATTSRPATPVACPKLPPAPPNVMRPPTSELRLRALLLESVETPTTNSVPAKP
jgi:hypothetical protein